MDLQIPCSAKCAGVNIESHLRPSGSGNSQVVIPSNCQRAQKALNAVKKWCTIAALLAVDEPEFLGTEQDPLWVGPMIEKMSPVFHRRLNKTYCEKLESLKRNVKNQKRE